MYKRQAFALWLFVAPPGLAMGNGAFYFDISPLLLVVTAAAAYLILSLFHRFFQKGAPPKSIYDVTVTVEGHSITPVSYTHLDVYKRQRQGHGNAYERGAWSRYHPQYF